MRSRRPVLVFVFVLGVFVHIESLGYWFTAGDTLALIETGRITSFEDFRSILTEPLMHGTKYLDIGLFYRPVASFTYAIDHWLWGLNPFGYHLTNVLLHGFAAALVVSTVHSLTAFSRAGWLSGVLFAIHPLSVDTVPAISRRQDILLAIFGLLTLWLFVEGLRQESSQRLHRVAAIAYGLALLSKETAIILGPLAFLWALFQEPSLRCPQAYWRAACEVLPLAGVATAYLAVRVVVLGGIGGYSRSPPISTMLLMPVEYVLALVYPAHFFGALGEISRLLMLAFGVGVPMIYLILLHRKRSFRDLSVIRLLLVTSVIIGFGAVSAMVAFPTVIQSVTIQNVDYLAWYAVGLVFALATTSAILTALSLAQISLNRSSRQDIFFLMWLIIPLPLFFVGKEFLFRSAYFFVIPLLALLATYLVKVVALFEKNGVSWSVSADAAFAFAILVLLVPSLASSPLLYTDSGWDAVGDTTEQALTGIDEEVTAVDENTHVIVSGIPYRVRYHPQHLGEARERTMLHPFSVRSWLRLREHENTITVRGTQTFRTAPRAVSTVASQEGGALIISIRYESRRTPAARHKMIPKTG